MRKSILFIVLLVIMSITLMACTSVDDSSIDSSPNGDDIVEDLPPVEDKPEVVPPESVPQDEPKPDTRPLVPLTRYDTVLISTTKRANIRSGASTKSRVVGTLDMGEGLAMAERTNDRWYKVHYKSKYAYISSSLVREVHMKMSRDTAIERVIDEGKRLLGYPYVWGSQRYHWGNGVLNKNFKMGEFDCSALMQYIYYKGAGVNINVNTRTQVLDGRVVRDEVRRGDLMFFTNAYRRYKAGIDKVGHVAIYLGDNYILHTASTYALIEEISESRWRDYLVSKRFF